MPVRVLRDTLTEHAKVVGEFTEARFDGIVGRRIGRRWKVWLSNAWTAPEDAAAPRGRRGATLPLRGKRGAWRQGEPSWPCVKKTGAESASWSLTSDIGRRTAVVGPLPARQKVQAATKTAAA